MRTRLKSLAGIALAVVLAGAAAAQSASTPTDAQLTDARLTVSTLVREDLFAGFLTGDMTALSRGEANLEKLYTARPNARGETRAWQAGAAMYRAVRAREAGNNAQYSTPRLRPTWARLTSSSPPSRPSRPSAGAWRCFGATASLRPTARPCGTEPMATSRA